MKAFKYTVARSEKDACSDLGESSLALAGGTNILSLMKDRVLEPDVLVDIKRIPGLDRIESEGEGLRIGSNVTIAELLSDRRIAEGYPVLRQALAELGTPQVRNRSTIGGNLTGRPYCWYFTHEGYQCAKKGDPSCAAKNGENEYHAIFETDGPCVIVHPSSSAPALIALGGSVRIAGKSSSREVSLEDFFILPSEDVRRENVLEPSEIVTHVTIGPPKPQSATYEVRQKAAHDWPLALAAVALDLSFGEVKDARVVLGAVAPVPRRSRAAEDALKGEKVSEQTAERAAEAALEGAEPLAQNAYKTAAARAAVKRAILVAGTGKWN